MNKFSCPHCGKPGITVVRKMYLGPAWPATCKACGKKVGVPWIASLAALIPLLLVIIFGVPLVESPALKVAFAVGVGVVWMIIVVRWVPLERR